MNVPYLIRGCFLDFSGDPFDSKDQIESSVRFLPDGLLAVNQDTGHIVDFGIYADIAHRFQKAVDVHFTDRLILPGLIDAHVHYPQFKIPGAYGGQLFEWWYRWVLPEEIRFDDPLYARSVAETFLDEMLLEGTTTCLAFTTIHPVATEALFEAARSRGLRIITGLTGLDLKVPDTYSISAGAFARESRRLIERYHEKERLLYAVTPRYALGCSKEMLKASALLLDEYQRLWVNTHIAECPAEVHEARMTFPAQRNLTAVFEDFGLLRPRFVGGHGVWLSDSELKRFSQAGAAISHCPSSNFFLGSGLFRTGKALDPKQRVPLALGSDVAGGPSLSLFKVMGDAYRVGMQNRVAMESENRRDRLTKEALRNRLDPLQLLYLGTYGAAKALHLDAWLGNFEPGKEADFIVLDPLKGGSLQTIAQHQSQSQISQGTLESVKDALFRVMMMGDKRNIEATWIGGRPAKMAQGERLNESFRPKGGR